MPGDRDGQGGRDEPGGQAVDRTKWRQGYEGQRQPRRRPGPTTPFRGVGSQPLQDLPAARMACADPYRCISHVGAASSAMWLLMTVAATWASTSAARPAALAASKPWTFVDTTAVPVRWASAIRGPPSCPALEGNPPARHER